MNYYSSLIIRILLAVVIPIQLFYFVFKPITIGLSEAVFRIIGYSTSVVGDYILVKNKLFEFLPACIAASAYYLLILLILFTKDINFILGFKLFISGAALLLGMNILRIFILVLVLIKYGVNYFEAVHLFFWTFIASVFVVLVWIFLIKWYGIKSIPVYSDVKYFIKLSRSR